MVGTALADSSGTPLPIVEALVRYALVRCRRNAAAHPSSSGTGRPVRQTGSNRHPIRNARPARHGLGLLSSQSEFG